MWRVWKMKMKICQKHYRRSHPLRMIPILSCVFDSIIQKLRVTVWRWTRTRMESLRCFCFFFTSPLIDCPHSDDLSYGKILKLNRNTNLRRIFIVKNSEKRVFNSFPYGKIVKIRTIIYRLEKKKNLTILLDRVRVRCHTIETLNSRKFLY